MMEPEPIFLMEEAARLAIVAAMNIGVVWGVGGGYSFSS